MKKLYLMVAMLFAVVGIAQAQVMVDFETGDLSQVPFVNDAYYPWTIVTDNVESGSFAMKSGNAGQDNTTSTISVTVTFDVDGDITFDVDCQGEGSSTFYDKGRFYIDGVIRFEHGADLTGWHTFSYSVTAGTHTFKWEYAKDGDINPTGDGLYIDNIYFDGVSSVEVFPIFINFETSDFSQYTFNNDASHPWYVTNMNSFDGYYSMMSSNSGEPGTEGLIYVSVDYPDDGYVSFYANCFGDENNHGVFLIDGAEVLVLGNSDGWNGYGYAITAGTHTFGWKYVKPATGDDPMMDRMFVDNISFELGACAAPTTVSVTPTGTTALVEWNGHAPTYTLRYRFSAESTWTEVTNIAENQYTLTDLTNMGDYFVEVEADCDPGTTASASFFIYVSASEAEWYAFVQDASCYYVANQTYINFSMKDPETCNNTATPALTYDIRCGAYAKGYVWVIVPPTETLLKAPVNMAEHTIGDFEVVKDAFASTFVLAMSYNLVDKRIYYISEGSSNLILWSFDPDHPETVTNHGSFVNGIITLAINKDGDAYGIDQAGDLYTIDLVTAATDKVGSTGLMLNYNNNALAFDMDTDELFLSASLPVNSGMYYVNHTSGSSYFMGQFGGCDAELTSLFMSYETTDVEETLAESLNVYPNPVNDKLFIDGVEGAMVRIYDSMGRMLMEEQYQGNIDVSKLAQGVYAASVGSRTVKFVKM